MAPQTKAGRRLDVPGLLPSLVPPARFERATPALGGLVFLFDLVFYNFFWIRITACKKAIFKKLDL